MLLERAGWIERQRQGRGVYISFRPEPLREVARWVHHYERFWAERLDEYMARKVKSAKLIEPGSARVISAFGDESHALVLVTFRIGLGDGAAG